MDSHGLASQLLEKAQKAQLNGEIQQALRLYKQYYSQRPFKFNYYPDAISIEKKALPRLSIIVPCYNSEKYILQCIESIQQQTFTDFELILVDDCSSDNSLSLILSKALLDDRIVVISNKIPSGSAGLPRNQALKVAKGDLIGFVDSDDWVGPSYFECLIDALDESDADVAITSGFINHQGDHSNERIYPDKWEIKCPSPELACTHMSSMIWDKVYKKSLLLENDIYLGSYPAAVDVPFIFKVYFYCQKSVVSKTKEYHYRRETNNSVTVRFRKGSSCDFEIMAYKEIFEWSAIQNIPDSYINFMRLKRLASFVYTCKLVKINFFPSYFDKCRQILIKSDNKELSKIISVSGQRSLDNIYNLFLNNNKKQFIDIQRPADSSYLVLNKKSREYSLAKTIELLPNNYDVQARNIVFFPDWSFGNPYQNLFYQYMRSAKKMSDVNTIGLDVGQVSIESIMNLINNGDIIHIHWVHPFITNDECMEEFCSMLKLLKFEKNAFIIWTIHNAVSHECSDIEEELRRRRHVSKLCDRFIVHSNYALSEVEKLYAINRDSIYVIPHGKYEVNIDNLYYEKNKLSSAKKKMRLTFLGELRSYKNVDFAAEFICKLNSGLEADQAVELRIAGKSISKVQKNYLHHLAENNDFISLCLKRLSDDELFTEFCMADFIFAPYSKLLTSGICINSISHGTPFLAPNFPSLSELHQESNSYLYANEEELSSAILRFNQLFHRGLLSHVFNPQQIILDSTHLMWSSIFSSLNKDPFDIC